MSCVRPTKVASAPSATDTGLNGWSSDPNDLCLAELVRDHTHREIGAETDRLSVAEIDQHVGPRVLVEDLVERAVVEDVAVLVHLDERRTLVLVRTAEDLGHVLAVHVVRAGHERGLGPEGDADRVEGPIEGAVRRRLGDLAQLAGG